MVDRNIAALIDEDAKRESKTSFRRYVGYTKPDYTFGWFNELLCMVLQDAYDKMQAGEFPRIMVFAPPRSGKSELGSRRFPAWALGRDPSLQFIGTSYGGDLADDMSSDTKDIIQDEAHQEIFQDTRLPSMIKGATGKEKISDWVVVNRDGAKTGGMYRGRGIGGGISGKGFNIGLIDDPVKDYAQASSKAYQEKVVNWYNTTFYTRRDPIKNAIILIMTRWHKKDLAGYLLENMENGGNEWTLVNFPMECEERQETFKFNGKLYKTRKKGDILFPERMPLSFVNDCKTDDLTWSALYQQRPNIAGGNYFKRDYFNQYDYIDKFERMIITGDTAQKTNTANDFSVFQCWGLLKGKIYLVDQIRGKWEAHELKRQAWGFWDKWGGGIVGASVKASAMYVEDKVSGTGLIQELRAGGYDYLGDHHKPVPIIGIPRNIDKVTRAIDAQPSFVAGFIHVPESAPWLNSYLMEFEDFSLDDTHANDDQIDPTLDAIDILIKGAGGVNYNANW